MDLFVCVYIYIYIYIYVFIYVFYVCIFIYVFLCMCVYIYIYIYICIYKHIKEHGICSTERITVGFCCVFKVFLASLFSFTQASDINRHIKGSSRDLQFLWEKDVVWIFPPEKCTAHLHSNMRRCPRLTGALKPVIIRKFQDRRFSCCPNSPF